MPSATNDNRTLKSTSPEVGISLAPVNQISCSCQVTGTHSEAMKQVVGVIEKKVRNMEKKKSKLDDYHAKNKKGECLNQDQLEALSKYKEVINNLEFARELHKSFLVLSQDMQKAAKKAVRREQLQRDEAEQAKLKKVMEMQLLLNRLRDENVRQELLQSDDTTALLTEGDLKALGNFYKLVMPEHDQHIRLTDQYQEASQHLWDLLEGKDQAVAGSTYKVLKETLERVLQSGYFDQVQSHQNGVYDDEKCAAEAESSEAEDQHADTEGEMMDEFAELVLTETTEIVNRHFIPETTYSSCEKEPEKERSIETKVEQSVPAAPVPKAHVPTPTPSSDHLVRKQVVQDLMAQIQGPYNFMQDSMLEFDPQPLDPAIVSALPMKPANNMEMSQMVCPSAHPESCHAQPPTIPVPPEPSQVPIVPAPLEAYSSPPLIYQHSHTSDPRSQANSIEPSQDTVSLAEQAPPPSALSSTPQTQMFQPSSKPLHNSGINVNAAPFQSMQMVFSLNMPVPSATGETESSQQTNQYQSSYSQGFSSTPQHQHSAEQTGLQTEQHQPVVCALQEQSLPSSTGHQSQQPVNQGSVFSRQAQSFYNSRGMSHGGPRNSRGAMNGFKGSSNPFRGSYDNYRPPFPGGAPNSGYGQAQFGTARDYSNGNYQRENYQQNYKRTTGQGPRGISRGNAQPLRP